MELCPATVTATAWRCSMCVICESSVAARCECVCEQWPGGGGALIDPPARESCPALYTRVQRPCSRSSGPEGAGGERFSSADPACSVKAPACCCCPFKVQKVHAASVLL